MQAIRSIRNIALIGFMGVGKTTVGHLLSEMTGYELIDTDRCIERRAGRRITEIFAQEGEEAFRRMERELVAGFEGVSERIISTGGGLVMDPANFASLRRHSLLVCLWATPETIYERVRHQSHRPLLHGPDPLGKIRELLAQRAPVYRKADLMVGVDFRHATDVARHIVRSFRDAQARPLPATEV